MAVVMTAVPVAFALSAAPSAAEMRFACAKKSDGLLRYVTRASACTSNERA